MLKEELKVTGNVAIEIRGPNGKVKEKLEVKNLVVTTGKNLIASRLVNSSSNVMTHMALGSGNAAASVGNTALGNQLGRVALDSAAASGNSISYAAYFPAGVATGAVTEAGIFNANSDGEMLCRTVFGVINKGVEDTMNITWVVTIN